MNVVSVNDVSVNVVRCTRARMRQSTGTFFVAIVAQAWRPLRTPRFPHPSAILMGDYISLEAAGLEGGGQEAYPGKIPLNIANQNGILLFRFMILFSEAFPGYGPIQWT